MQRFSAFIIKKAKKKGAKKRLSKFFKKTSRLEVNLCT